MRDNRKGWLRVVRAIDAITLAQLLTGSLVFVVWHSSPLIALGSIFAGPIVLVMIASICRWLRFATTGRVVGSPPARLGLPPSQRRPTDAPTGNPRRRHSH